MSEEKREILLGRKRRERLSKAFKEQRPTSSTLPNPPTPRVSMMLKSDSFRLAKKAASASYLDFLMRKNGNFLEVQTRVPRTTVAEWQDCGTGFTCWHSILLLESVFSHTHTVLVPRVQQNIDLHLLFFFFFSKEKNTKYPLHAHPVTDKSSYQIKVTSWSFSTRLLVSTDCLSSFVVLFWIFLDLRGFGFAVQILEGSFSLASLIHRLAVASINVCYKRQDHWGLWSEVTARSYANRSKKLRADVQMPALDGLRSIFAFLKSVFPSFMFTHWLSAGNPRVFMCASFLYEWWEKHGRGSQGLTMHTCKSDTCECVRCKISISWWDKWTWAA